MLYSTFILVYCFTARAQQIELLGSYSASFIGGETITFTGIDSFYFNGFYCTNGVYGRGKCEITDGNLYLYFSTEREIKKELRKHEVQQVKTPDSKKLVEISCLMMDGLRIGRATVNVKLQNGIEIPYLSDSTGYIKIAIAADEFPITISTSAIGSETTAITLKDAADYSLKIFHRDYFEAVIKNLRSGEVFVYEIKDVSPGKIVMRRGTKGQYYEYKKQLNP
jgi:hypothetical protein